MLKHVALALFLGGQFVVAQYTIEEHEIGRVNKARCKDAQGFTCAVLFEFDPPVPSDSTASISGPLSLFLPFSAALQSCIGRPRASSRTKDRLSPIPRLNL